MPPNLAWIRYSRMLAADNTIKDSYLDRHREQGAARAA